MAKRTNSLTKRERECRKIVRNRATRKKLQTWWRRACIGFGTLGAVLFTAAGIWEYRDAGISRMVEHAVDAVYAATAGGGFAVHTVSLEGRHRTALPAITQALAIRRGDPILALSLDDVRSRLEQIPTVKHASVERQLPDKISVKLTERQPVAVWQLHGRLHLIDDEGTAMDDLALQDFQGLPLLVGQGAAGHVKEAMDILSANTAFAPRIAALIRVGDRRWNVRLSDGPEVKLPEQNPQTAWTHFATFAQTHGLTSEPLTTIDLRLPGRIILKPARTLPAQHDGTDA